MYGFKDSIFGPNAKLSRDVFIEKIITNQRNFLQPYELRDFVLSNL